MNQPRILFVLQYHYLRATGGAETQSWLIATELARRGWDVHYASETNFLPQPNPLQGVTLHGLPEDPSYWSGNRAALRKLMTALQPDVVYSRVFDVYAGHALLEAPEKAVKVWAVASAADYNFRRVVHTHWKFNTRYNFFKRLPVVLHHYRVAVRGVHRANIVLAQHEQQVEWLREAGMTPVIIRNSHPPVPTERVQTHSGTPVILWAGSIRGGKRPEFFLDLARRCRGLDANFVIVGRCDEEHYQREIEELQRESPRFQYPGLVPYSEVENYFARAHVFVSTSAAEGFPNTFIQSWMHGVPVVSLQVDPENLLRDRGVGICCSDFDTLERSVRDLVASPEQRLEIGAKARAFATQEFNLQKNIDKFERVLAEKGIRPPSL